MERCANKMGAKVTKMGLEDGLSGKDFLTLEDCSQDDLNQLLELAAILKNQQKLGKQVQPLQGKTLGMIFEKASTRTRVSFETGMFQLGGHALFLSPSDMQLGRGETIADTAKVLSGYLDGIMIRTYSQAMIEEMAAHATIPIINGLTDMYHPCQVLADLLTIQETKGGLKGVKVAYIGDGNNMAHSLLLGGAKMGMHIHIASPKGYEPDPNIVEKAKHLAEITGAQIEVSHQAESAASNADVLYTDVWTSMGQEKEQAERLAEFSPFQVNESLCALAKKDMVFMHCLPAHREQEVTAGVLDGSHSIVFQQAENRLHAQKALLVGLMA